MPIDQHQAQSQNLINQTAQMPTYSYGAYQYFTAPNPYLSYPLNVPGIDAAHLMQNSIPNPAFINPNGIDFTGTPEVVNFFPTLNIIKLFFSIIVMITLQLLIVFQLVHYRINF